MAALPFTLREMQTGWRKNFQAYKKASPPIHNAHRLLLFYAIECGLKSILMKRENAGSLGIRLIVKSQTKITLAA